MLGPRGAVGVEIGLAEIMMKRNINVFSRLPLISSMTSR